MVPSLSTASSNFSKNMRSIFIPSNPISSSLTSDRMSGPKCSYAPTDDHGAIAPVAVAVPGRRQRQHLVVVELGLEVLAVAEEIEELEGSSCPAWRRRP